MQGLTMARPTLLTLLLAVVASGEGCRAIEGIFKAGMFVGILMVVVVIGVIFAIVRGIST